MRSPQVLSKVSKRERLREGGGGGREGRMDKKDEGRKVCRYLYIPDPHNSQRSAVLLVKATLALSK